MKDEGIEYKTRLLFKKAKFFFFKNSTGSQTRGMEEKLNSRESNHEGTRPHIQDICREEEEMRINKALQ